MITITEALAEIPTLDKRIEKKKEFIGNFLYRQANLRDPHEKDGGSAKLIEQEMQAIKDLEERHVKIRLAIQQANSRESITVLGETHTIASWLTWRREVAPLAREFYSRIMKSLNTTRNQAMQKGMQVTTNQTSDSQNDIVVNINEKQIAEQAEHLENVLGILDGQLSLKNATVLIDL